MLEIFVSHSTQNDVGLKVRKAVIGELQGLQKYEVFWDEAATEGGDGWRGIIDEALDTCRAAVLILSAPAVESDWVAKEVNILLWRRARDPGIKVVPVLVPPVTPKDKRLEKFHPDQLLERTFIECDPSLVDADAGAIAADLAAKTRAAFEHTAFDEPDPTLSKWLETVREHVGQSPLLYQLRAAEALGMPEHERALQVPRAKSMRDLPERIAHRFLHAPHKQALRAVAELADGLSAKRLDRLCELVRPLWVKAEAASCIPPVMKLPDEKRILALNSQDFRSPRAFMARALCGDQRFRVIEVTKQVLSATAATDLFNHVQGVLEQAIGIRQGVGDEGEGEWFDEAPVDPKLVLFETLRKADMPLVLAIKKPAGAGTLSRLREFPHLTLMVLLGTQVPDIAALEQSSMRLIRPVLEPGEERQAWVAIKLELEELTKKRSKEMQGE
jgi:hypothetical protein